MYVWMYKSEIIHPQFHFIHSSNTYKKNLKQQIGAERSGVSFDGRRRRYDVIYLDELN
ncbi:hypothetical protein Hanom_Chr10g00952331 [Helianthus anomalus]